ncbi:MAG TPA: hypothetical protein VJJ76_02570 [archaeon]|nr:hypothetical protein [archaeon]
MALQNKPEVIYKELEGPEPQEVKDALNSLGLLHRPRSVVYAELTSLRLHLHKKTFELFVVSEGTGTLKQYFLDEQSKDFYRTGPFLRDKEFPLKQGVLVFIEPLTPHNIRDVAGVLKTYIVQMPTHDPKDEFYVQYF